MRVLGLEGTAWAASAAIYDTETDTVTMRTEAYVPESGGIHPREAAEHMAEHLPRLVEEVLEACEPEFGVDAGRGDDSSPVEAVAFSRGPGLGPCLRLVGTSARALAQRFDVPLVGVNHMVAHLEIGRDQADFDDPICLNASGANAHVLGYRAGSYRILGETMDTGVGNAIDKFARHLEWSHPGGPKVEAAARDGEYVDLPYVVKGMDFSFAGLASAAADAVDDGTPVEDVCCGLQETIFAMLTEVSERALSLTDRDELVLGGGVGQNDRLQAMLASMCEQRGASFYAPDDRFLRDNAGMIAVLGAKMYAADDTLAIEESGVDADFRPDEVSVTWRDSEVDTPLVTGTGPSPRSPAETTRPENAETTRPENAETTRPDNAETTRPDNAETTRPDDAETTRPENAETTRPHNADVTRPEKIDFRGAEATVTTVGDRVEKHRNPRAYRHPDLDARLRQERTRAEARLTSAARRAGVPTPLVHDIDPDLSTLTFQYVGERELREDVTRTRVEQVASYLARLHGAGLVHGDPTTRNIRIEPRDSDNSDVRLIDFGLGYHSDHPEDHAMDLHVFAGSLLGTEPGASDLVEAAVDAYLEAGDSAVINRFEAVQQRGRYR